jgi:tetratricopeptide (TPR) repeat protein
MHGKFLLAPILLAISPGLLADACEDGQRAHDRMDYEAAVAAFTRCLNENGGASAASLHRRGRAYMKAGRYDAALDDFSAAIEADAAYAPAWNSRAWVHYVQGDLAAADADIETAVRLAPVSPRVLDTRAHILAAQGDAAQAMVAFEQGMAQQSPAGVAKIQRKLRAQGIEPGPVDGLYGPRTRAALEACARAACNLWKQP